MKCLHEELSLSMKILTANRNYFVTGGPEKYLFSLTENMPQHEFIPFSVDFDDTLDTPYRSYFLKQPSSDSGVYFKDFKMSGYEKLKYALNSVYNFQARAQLEALIKDTKPDVALFLNAVFFSDSMIDSCKKYNVPIISRMSDFHKICSSYFLYRDGKTCEECLNSSLLCAVIHRCGGYQRSRAAACIKVAGMYLSRIRRIYDYIDYFICPSEFTRQKMIQGGFDPQKVLHIPTMVSVVNSPSVPNSQEILYVGRLSPEKGAETLLSAFEMLEHKQARLSIVGDDTSEYARKLKEGIPEVLRNRVKFHGFLNTEHVNALYEHSLCFVVPSVWYENQPNTALEGMSHARPAVVSDLGSLQEIVEDGVVGFRFETHNARDLAAKLNTLLRNPEQAHEMGLKGREYVLKAHSLQKHLSSIDELFSLCVERRRPGAFT